MDWPDHHIATMTSTSRTVTLHCGCGWHVKVRHTIDGGVFTHYSKLIEEYLEHRKAEEGT